MNKASEHVDGNARDDSGRNDPAAAQDGKHTQANEPKAGQRQQKTKPGTTARRRKPPFVL